ncbi:MAG: amidase [SAR202 cluster bacterium]|mgnify:CR=1 FL=1|nr:amidase [SAR202 cluster bacterium]
MLNNNLAFSSISSLKKLIHSKEISPVELVNMFVERIQKYNPKLNAFLTVSAEKALISAKKTESAILQNQPIGPLGGIPISVKDLELTEGITTTMGSLIFKDRIPSENSIVVERLLAAGAIILGKTNTPEFGFLGHTKNRLGDDCRNPWNTKLSSGGSSGGAASAVAAGLCVISTGSDGGGSSRIPASFCGVFGIKPTQGLVPNFFGSSSTPVVNLFSQAGPISRSVDDAEIMLKIISGFDKRDPNSIAITPKEYFSTESLPIKNLQFAWSTSFDNSPISKNVKAKVLDAIKIFENLGATGEEVEINVGDLFEDFWGMFSACAHAKLGLLLEKTPHLLTDYAKESLEYGGKISGSQFAQSLGKANIVKNKFASIFAKKDFIVTPTMAVTAFPAGNPPNNINGQQVNKFWGAFPFTYPINVAGLPAVSIPCGFSPEGLPVGLQIIGNYGSEARLLNISRAFESHTKYLSQNPPCFE